MAAKLNLDPIIDSDERRRLRDANETVHRTRLTLKHGRGNVAEDVGPSGGHNRIGTCISYDRCVPPKSVAGRTALALVLGAGNCDQNADLNTLAHSQKLAQGERVYKLGSHEMYIPGQCSSGHVWSEVYSPVTRGGRPSRIVMDSWSNGPAARLEDTIIAPHAGGARLLLSLGQEGVEAMSRKIQILCQQYAPNGQPNDSLMMDLQRERIGPPKMLTGAEGQLIDPNFAQTARTKLKAMSAFSQEIMAVGTAREAYGLSVAQATKRSTTEPIIEEAGRLDRQNRPPVTKPSF